MELGLSGKVAIVTGGSAGLGRGIARGLAAEGVNLILNYRSSGKKAEETAEKIRSEFGVKVVTVQADVSKEEDVKNLYKIAEKELGIPDILVNNSGVCPVSMVRDMDFSEWQDVMAVNMGGVFLMSKEFVNCVERAGKGGRIINIVSQAAFNGSKNGKSHYAASKGGVVSFTHSLANEVSREGITVNAVAPGMMFTEMTRELLTKDMASYNAKIPMGRIAEVEEVANVVTFLASEAASYITGTTIDVSGGMFGR